MVPHYTAFSIAHWNRSRKMSNAELYLSQKERWFLDRLMLAWFLFHSGGWVRRYLTGLLRRVRQRRRNTTPGENRTGETTVAAADGEGEEREAPREGGGGEEAIPAVVPANDEPTTG